MGGYFGRIKTQLSYAAIVIALSAGCGGAQTHSSNDTPTPTGTETPTPTPPGDYQVQTTIGFSAGGGNVETSRYKAHLIIGGFSPAGAAATTQYQAAVGVGTSQHAQVILYLPGQGG